MGSVHPFESYNRTMFTINDEVDPYALKPVAMGYVFVVPEPVLASLTNFFSNIGDVYLAANDLLQLKVADGASDIMRIAMKSCSTWAVCSTSRDCRSCRNVPATSV